MGASVNEEAALRIALATKRLAKIGTKDLLDLIIGIMGDPITPTKLDKLRARTLRNAGAGFFNGIDDQTFDQAFALLKGRGVQKFMHPKPDIAFPSHSDERGSLRVACASNSDENIDGQFSTCIRFLIYSVSASSSTLVDIREVGLKKNGRNSQCDRAELIGDCALVYTTSIGAAAAAKVIKVGVHPVQTHVEVQAAAEIFRLQHVLTKDSPPPWLLKTMTSKPAC